MVHFNSSMGPASSPEEGRGGKESPLHVPEPKQPVSTPEDLSSYLDSLSSWAEDSSDQLGSNVKETMQSQIQDLQQSLQGQKMITPDNLASLQEMLQQVGVPLSQDQQSALLQTAAEGADRFVHGELTAFDAQVLSMQKASGLPQEQSQQLVIGPRQQIQSMVDGIASQVDTIKSMAWSSSTDLSTTFKAVASGAQDASEEMQNTLKTLSSQMQSIQKTVAVTSLQNTPSTILPYSNQIYDAMNNLYFAWYFAAGSGGSSANPPTGVKQYVNTTQNMYTLYQAVNEFMTAAKGASLDPATQNIYNILNTSFAGEGTPSLASLASAAASSGSYGPMSSADFSSFIYGEPNNASVAQELFSNLNGSNSWFDKEKASGTNPYPPMFVEDFYGSAQIGQALSALQNDTFYLNQGQNTSIWAQKVAEDISSLQAAIKAYTGDYEGGSGNLDGYISYIQNYLNAPLDESGDTLDSLASAVLSNNPPSSSDVTNLVNQLGGEANYSLYSITKKALIEELSPAYSPNVLNTEQIAEEMQNTQEVLTSQMQKVQSAVADSTGQGVGNTGSTFQSDPAGSAQIATALSALQTDLYWFTSSLLPSSTQDLWAQRVAQDITNLLSAISDYTGTVDANITGIQSFLNTSLNGSGETFASLASAILQKNPPSQTDISNLNNAVHTAEIGGQTLQAEATAVLNDEMS